LYGPDGNYGAAVLDNPGWIYPDTGYNILDIYDYLTTLDGSYNIFTDSLSDLNSVFRFWEGSLAANGTDTLTFWKVKTVSLSGLSGLQALIDKGKAFALKYEGIINPVLAASPTTLNFNHTLGTKNAAPQQVLVTESKYGFNIDYDITVNDGGDGWLETLSLFGTTPSSFFVDYDAGVANSLGEGVYNGTVTVISPDVNDTVTVAVTLNVTTQTCQGRCGDANEDGSVNVSDAVYVINYVFITGSPEPKPVKACGDANSDASVNVSDAVYIINYVFIVGSPAPSDCSPGAPAWGGLDCCAF